MSNLRFCTVCQNNYGEADLLAVTRCRHIFHRHCILEWLSRSSTCPVCRCAVTKTSLLEYYLPPLTSLPANSGAIPKSTERVLLSKKARKKNTDANRNLSFPPVNESVLPRNSVVITDSGVVPTPNEFSGAVGLGDGLLPTPSNFQSIWSQNLQNNPAPSGLATSSPNSAQPTNAQSEPQVNSASATVNTNPIRQNTIPTSENTDNDLELRVQSQFQRLERIMTQMSEQIAQLSVRDRNVDWPQEDFPPIANDFRPPMREQSRPANQPINISIPATRDRTSNSSFMITNSSKVANIISSWHITFSGVSSHMPVEKFIYMINSLVADSLAGDFSLLNEHSHLLFTAKAKDWYWRYRRSVPIIEWQQLCIALQQHFNDHLTDTDVREQIRDRKQNFNESFDDFYSDILQICDRLRTTIPDYELVEILRRNLRPHIRKELFYLRINSMSELRQLVLRREALSKELDQNNRLPPPRRQVHELESDHVDVEIVENQSDQVCEFREKKNLNPCYNCKEIGHIYKDCLAPKTIFCYGCGLSNVYKPQCPKCNPGNSQASSSNNTSLRSRPQ